jgi:hypothetical protein
MASEQPDPNPKQDGFFEGVGDMEEEDIAGNAQMATYREVVMNSSGYQWFIDSLMKQLSLDWGSKDATEASSCHLIRQSIMSRLPSGMISRHRPPRIHRARFRIQMHPDVFPSPGKRPFAYLRALTSSAPNIVQSLSVKDYLNQTWSSGGLRLVEIIQKACSGEYGVTHTGMSPTSLHTDHFHT